MRKRVYGVVFAMLLGTGVITQLPNSKQSKQIDQQLADAVRAGSKLSPAQDELLAVSRLPFHSQDRPPDVSPVRVHRERVGARSRSRSTQDGASLIAAPVSLSAFAKAAAAVPSPPPPPPPPPPPRPAPRATAPAYSGDVWAELRGCESNGNYADDTGNGYYGAYQFALSTWHSLGLSGLPSQAAPSVQDQAAHELQARSGWGQWPVCSRRLGLT